MKVMVVDGKRVRDPGSKLILKPGELRDVPETTFWLRRLAEGDAKRVEKEEKPSDKK